MLAALLAILKLELSAGFLFGRMASHGFCMLPPLHPPTVLLLDSSLTPVETEF